MNGPEHYHLAEELAAMSGKADGTARDQILARAQVHATLALVAAQAEPWANETNDRTATYMWPEWAEAIQ